MALTRWNVPRLMAKMVVNTMHGVGFVEMVEIFLTEDTSSFGTDPLDRVY